MSDAKYTEFDFRGTPAQAKAMREALSKSIDRGDVKIALAIGQDLDPLEVAETVRVRQGCDRYDAICKQVRELLPGN